MTRFPFIPHRARPVAVASLLLGLAAPLAAACEPTGVPDGAATIPSTSVAVTVPEPETTVTVPDLTASTVTVTTAPAGAIGSTTTTGAAKPALPSVPVPTAHVPGAAVPLNAGGLGSASWGDGVDETITRLSALLGAPDAPGFTGGGFGACGMTASRFVRWGDLQVQFTGHGGDLRFTGFSWGESHTLPSSPIHSAPTGPGRPDVVNPWGLRIGGWVQQVDHLLADVRSRFPDASLLDHIHAGDSAVSMTVAPHIRLVIDLHPVQGGGFVVERLRAFDERDLFC